MRLRWWQACAGWLLFSACSHKTVSVRIAEHDRVRESWVQTVRFVASEWTRRAVPDAFADRALARAREELAKEKKSLQADPLPDAERTRLNTSLDSAIAFGDALANVLSSADSGAAVRLVQRAPMPNADSLRRQAELK